MEILFNRGNEAYIVKQNGKFYLVNLISEKAVVAIPPNSPDMFLKFGYFENVKKLAEDVTKRIEKIMQAYFSKN